MIDPGAELAEIIAAIDPDNWLRLAALALAENRCDRSKNHNEVMAIADAYLEYIDPVAMTDGRVQVTLVKKP